MKNIQVIDGADNATYSIFQAEDREFALIFPDGRDMELSEDFLERTGEETAREILSALWQRPILKRDAMGIHGTLFYNNDRRREFIPATKREVDWDPLSLSASQRLLFAQSRQA